MNTEWGSVVDFPDMCVYIDKCVVDSKYTLQWCLRADEADSAKHFAVQPHKGTLQSLSFIFVTLSYNTSNEWY